MKVAFRADAGLALGTGHVMRCLTLADQLRAAGATTRFLCRPLDGQRGEYIAARGHALVWLPLREDLARDAEDSRAALADQSPWDWLVVDHYGLNAGWEREMRAVAGKIMVIDDLADRPHDCDLLLDQNLQAPGRYAGRVPEGCPCLLGPKYALLRPQFAAARATLRPRDGRVARILVFFGGADAGGATLKALQAIRQLGRDDLAVDVVIGATNPHRAAIEAAYQALPGAVLRCQVEDMAARMAAADLFVGAGGISSWERCCLGLPALVMATADNQVTQSELLARVGAQIYLGPSSSIEVDGLARWIESLMALPDTLIHMAEQGKSLVDGRGVNRVADHLLADALLLRRAEATDSAAIHRWRNHPDTRRHAGDPAEIDFERHERWFSRVLADPDRLLLIAERDGQPIGVLRYDIENGLGTVSIYVVPGLAGQGWGRRLLIAGERWLRRARPDVTACVAEVLADNAASVALFQGLGFQPQRTVFRKDFRVPC
ncbi:MAG: UDP-2,4-diacetamido-2,4,6-trideoxy-beta-L-altropyranose hydrolase [Methylophilaceae bacterium]|nr:UDP-2,4-diacetamido-2,4,6-trideoxy-beta-L-altropyranose hydrolase [Methylophilaceae bacterium]